MSGEHLSFDSGARRAVDALVGQLAAETVLLRFASPPTAGSAGEQLGLPSPEFHDLAVTPAMVRLQARRTVVLISATALETALGLTGEQAVTDALAAVSFVQLGDRLFTLQATERRTVYGRAYLYRLLLRDPATRDPAARNSAMRAPATRASASTGKGAA